MAIHALPMMGYTLGQLAYMLTGVGIPHGVICNPARLGFDQRWGSNDSELPEYLQRPSQESDVCLVPRALPSPEGSVAKCAVGIAVTRTGSGTAVTYR